MLEFLKTSQWSLSRVGVTPGTTPWSLDRNWHRAEAERHLKSRNFREALRHLSHAVEDADQRNATPKQRIRLRLELADTQRRTAGAAETDSAKLAEAEATIRVALAIAGGVGDREEYVNCLDALADVFTDGKRYAELELLEEEALKLGAGLAHPDPIRMAKRVHRLGVARHKNGHAEEAIPALEKSLRLYEQTYGAESAELAGLLYEVGCMYRAQGEYTRAQGSLRRAMQLHERVTGPDSQEAMNSVQQLAGAYEDAGDLNGAAAQYERCLMMKLRKLGTQNLEEVADMQYGLANLHAGWGNLPRARELLMDCIGAFRRDGGPRLAVTHERLAQIEERSGRFHSAVKEAESAGKVWEKCGASRVGELIGNLKYRADILEQLRKTKEASWLRERVAGLEMDQPTRAQSARGIAS